MSEILDSIKKFNRERVRQDIVRFIRQKYAEAGVRSAVMGLSGGIDSSLTLRLAVDALGPDKIHVLILPHTSLTPKEDIEDAYDLVNELGVKNVYEISIDDIAERFVDKLSDRGVKVDEKAKGNILARTRMVLLYATANTVKGFVIGTGDKSEILIGYYTKYGDGGVDILPIGDLYKTRVREMGRYLHLPTRIVEKPSSPRLWPDHMAEKELGVTYDVVDVILYAYIDLRMHIGQIYEINGIKQEHVNIVLKRVVNSEHKRLMPPIPKLFGGMTIGIDWRMPHYYETI